MGGVESTVVGSGSMQSVSEGIRAIDKNGNVVQLPSGQTQNSAVDPSKKILIGGKGELTLEYWSINRTYSGKFRASTTSNNQGPLNVTVFIDDKQVRTAKGDLIDIDARELFGAELSALRDAKTFKATAEIGGAVHTIYEVSLSGTADALKQMKLIPDYNYNVRRLGRDAAAKEAHDAQNSDQPPKCFLTSACCGVVGLDDGCFELSSLRRFRDTVLLASEDGRRDVELYYALAPRILGEMHRRRESSHLRSLYCSTILPCAILAALRLHRPTRLLYGQMMQRLTARYIDS